MSRDEAVRTKGDADVKDAGTKTSGHTMQGLGYKHKLCGITMLAWWSDWGWCHHILVMMRIEA